MRMLPYGSQGFAGDDDGQRGKGRPEAATLLLHLKAECAELGRVLAGSLVIGDESDSAGTKNTHDVMKRRGA
jgi:hypothetical protein